MATALLDDTQRAQITQVYRFVRAASLAARFKVADWAYEEMSDGEFRQLTTYLNMNVDRLEILSQQVIEGIRSEEIPVIYLNCLINDWEFSWDGLKVPNIDTYWPVGLNYGLDAIREKYKPRD